MASCPPRRPRRRRSGKQTARRAPGALGDRDPAQSLQTPTACANRSECRNKPDPDGGSRDMPPKDAESARLHGGGRKLLDTVDDRPATGSACPPRNPTNSSRHWPRHSPSPRGTAGTSRSRPGRRRATRSTDWYWLYVLAVIEHTTRRGKDSRRRRPSECRLGDPDGPERGHGPR
jgi:hypothetical protein